MSKKMHPSTRVGVPSTLQWYQHMVDPLDEIGTGQDEYQPGFRDGP
jgi:hypothetical protein